MTLSQCPASLYFLRSMKINLVSTDYALVFHLNIWIVLYVTMEYWQGKKIQTKINWQCSVYFTAVSWPMWNNSLTWKINRYLFLNVINDFPLMRKVCSMTVFAFILTFIIAIHNTLNCIIDHQSEIIYWPNFKAWKMTVSEKFLHLIALLFWNPRIKLRSARLSI